MYPRERKKNPVHDMTVNHIDDIEQIECFEVGEEIPVAKEKRKSPPCKDKEIVGPWVIYGNPPCK